MRNVIQHVYSFSLYFYFIIELTFRLCRQRPALGECLAHLAAAMPVAYLEPSLNEFNAFSVYTTKTPRERASAFKTLFFFFFTFNYKDEAG